MVKCQHFALLIFWAEKREVFCSSSSKFLFFQLTKMCLPHTRDYAKFIRVMSLLPSDSVPCFWCHFNPEALLFLQMLFWDVTTPILFLCLNIYEKCFAQDMTCMKKQKEFKKEFVKVSSGQVRQAVLVQNNLGVLVN